MSGLVVTRLAAAVGQPALITAPVGRAPVVVRAATASGPSAALEWSTTAW